MGQIIGDILPMIKLLYKNRAQLLHPTLKAKAGMNKAETDPLMGKDTPS